MTALRECRHALTIALLQRYAVWQLCHTGTLIKHRSSCMREFGILRTGMSQAVSPPEKRTRNSAQQIVEVESFWKSRQRLRNEIDLNQQYIPAFEYCAEP